MQLPANYEKALAVIDEKLLYWPNEKFFKHKCKQRLTRLTQVAIRERRIAKEEERLGEKIVPRLASKVRRREDTRERKAESAAKVERKIEVELIERLRSGAYMKDGNQPLNVEEGVWKKVLKGLERAEKGEEVEFEDEEEEEEEREVEVEYVSDMEESEAEEMEDFNDWLGDESGDEGTDVSGEDEASEEDSEDDEEQDDSEGGAKKAAAAAGAKRKRGAPQTKPRKKVPKMEIEYEMESPAREVLLA